VRDVEVDPARAAQRLGDRVPAPVVHDRGRIRRTSRTSIRGIHWRLRWRWRGRAIPPLALVVEARTLPRSDPCLPEDALLDCLRLKGLTAAPPAIKSCGRGVALDTAEKSPDLRIPVVESVDGEIAGAM